MSETLQARIAATIARTPDWIRQELQSKEAGTRERAEEALAAMIAAALDQSSGSQAIDS